MFNPLLDQIREVLNAWLLGDSRLGKNLPKTLAKSALAGGNSACDSDCWHVGYDRRVINRFRRKRKAGRELPPAAHNYAKYREPCIQALVALVTNTESGGMAATLTLAAGEN